jgi:tRNA-binding EMAP/Myf-like protein
MKTKEKIGFTEFLEIEKKLDIRMGQVVDAIRIPKKDKLLQFTVIFGGGEDEMKTSVTNLGEFFEPDDFVGEFFPFIVNLTPSKLGGIMSDVMIMVATSVLEGRDGQIELKPNDYTMGSKLL